jgi:hypothetical protein
MRKIIITFFPFILPFIFFTCLEGDEQIINPLDNSILYYNSYESAKDTIGLKGYAAIQLRNEASPNGGKNSLFISGGCIVPHAVCTLNVVKQDCFVKLQCWGKALVGGGGVTLGYKVMQQPEISISIKDSVWTFYESSEILKCESNKPLLLHFISGGFVPGAMLVDQVKIIKTQ